MWERIEEMMFKNRDSVISEGTRRVTFEEAVEIVKTVAKDLKGEKCVGVDCDSEFDQALGILACFAANVTAVPFCRRYGKIHTDSILEVINPTAFITDGLYIERREDRYSPPDEAPALIMFTSGTTGKPKGVMMSGEGILANIEGICRYFKIGAEDTMLIARPLFHSAVLVGEFLTAIFKGCSIRFHSGKFDPLRLSEIIRDEGVTIMCGTPTFMGIMARFIRHGETGIRKIAISGEILYPEKAKKIREAFPCADIYHVYGLTEAGPRVSYLPPESFNDRSDCVGVPLDNVCAKLVEEYPGIKILYVKSMSIMKGYYGDPEKTREVLNEGWLRTGDIAEIEESYLKLRGRLDGLIIRSGMNIYPAEIERRLSASELVREVVAFGKWNNLGDVKIILRISGNFKDRDEVRQLCVKLLPAYEIPDVIELYDELPKNASGKLLRN